MAGLAAARWQWVPCSRSARHARRRVLQTWFAAVASRTCCWKPIAGQYVLLRCATRPIAFVSFTANFQGRNGLRWHHFSPTFWAKNVFRGPHINFPCNVRFATKFTLVSLKLRRVMILMPPPAIVSGEHYAFRSSPGCPLTHISRDAILSSVIGVISMILDTNIHHGPFNVVILLNGWICL